MARYWDDPDHPALLFSNGKPNPTRQNRFSNRLYCMVWPDHDLLKLGLGSGRGNARSGAALETLRAYLSHYGAVPGPYTEWRADLPFLEGAAWGDCQRFEMVMATALARRLGASAATGVGFEWLARRHLENVRWSQQLAAASTAAVDFSDYPDEVRWEEYTPARGGSGNKPALDAHRTMRNQKGSCALKGCGQSLPRSPAKSGRFEYCSPAHAEFDAASDAI